MINENFNSDFDPVFWKLDKFATNKRGITFSKTTLIQGTFATKSILFLRKSFKFFTRLMTSLWHHNDVQIFFNIAYATTQSYNYIKCVLIPSYLLWFVIFWSYKKDHLIQINTVFLQFLWFFPNFDNFGRGPACATFCDST